MINVYQGKTRLRIDVVHEQAVLEKLSAALKEHWGSLSHENYAAPASLEDAFEILDIAAIRNVDGSIFALSLLASDTCNSVLKACLSAVAEFVQDDSYITLISDDDFSVWVWYFWKGVLHETEIDPKMMQGWFRSMAEDTLDEKGAA